MGCQSSCQRTPSERALGRAQRSSSVRKRSQIHAWGDGDKEPNSKNLTSTPNDGGDSATQQKLRSIRRARDYGVELNSLSPQVSRPDDGFSKPLRDSGLNGRYIASEEDVLNRVPLDTGPIGYIQDSREHMDELDPSKDHHYGLESMENDISGALRLDYDGSHAQDGHPTMSSSTSIGLERDLSITKLPSSKQISMAFALPDPPAVCVCLSDPITTELELLKDIRLASKDQLTQEWVAHEGLRVPMFAATLWRSRDLKDIVENAMKREILHPDSLLFTNELNDGERVHALTAMVMDTYKRLREKNEGQVPENAAQLLQTGSISPSELYRKVHPPVFLTGKAAHRILLEDEIIEWTDTWDSVSLRAIAK